MTRNAHPEPATIRRFTLLDAVVLIAAIAIGLAGVRGGWIEFPLLDRPDGGWTGLAVIGRIPLILLIVMPCFTTLNIAVLLLRFRRPRPRLRRLFLQPGAAACGAVFLTWLTLNGTGLMFVAIDHIWGDVTLVRDSTGVEETLSWSLMMGGPYLFSASPSLAVLIAWSLLFSIGRWRAEPTWIDRVGRSMGIVWLLVGLALFYIGCLMMCHPSWIAPLFRVEYGS